MGCRKLRFDLDKSRVQASRPCRCGVKVSSWLLIAPCLSNPRFGERGHIQRRQKVEADLRWRRTFSIWPSRNRMRNWVYESSLNRSVRQAVTIPLFRASSVVAGVSLMSADMVPIGSLSCTQVPFAANQFANCEQR